MVVQSSWTPSVNKNVAASTIGVIEGGRARLESQRNGEDSEFEVVYEDHLDVDGEKVNWHLSRAFSLSILSLI